MAVYTILNIDNVNEIMARYGISEVTHHAELSGGFQNSNYVIRSQQGDFVLSICEKKSKEEVENLAFLLEHLANNDFSSSILIRTIDHEVMTYWDDKPVMVKKLINGIVEENIPEHLVTLIGREIGKLHKVPSPKYIPDSLDYGNDYFYEVEEYAKGSDFHKWLLDKQNYIACYITDTMPKALIHSDVFSSNVIIDDSRQFVTIMDFEEATYYYRLFDVGMAVIGICREGEGINFQKSKALLQGYMQEVNLIAEEMKSLQAFIVYAAASMSFWRHRNFNYIVPTPELHDHYKELKKIADTVYELDNDVFMDLIL